MGTVFTIDVRGAGDWSDAVADVVALLHRVDRVFSTYRADSDISRMQRRELRLADADPQVADVLALCAQVQATTRGWFTALHHGRIDPTGLVKGWAIEAASARLRAHGSTHHLVNGGGDVQLAGGPDGPGSDRPWTVGVADPHDRGRVLTTVTGRDLAVATSGVAERGAHITDPFTGRPATHLAAATVVGPSLTLADAYATAAFVMGDDALAWIDDVPGYAALLVDPDGRVRTSRHWPGDGSVASPRHVREASAVATSRG